LDEFSIQSKDEESNLLLRNSHLLQLELLDFGASRGFGQEFIDDYIAILKAAANLDREACREISLRLGYLTGRETEAKALDVRMLTLVDA